MKKRRIVVCVKCGCLYDVHYIDKIVLEVECKKKIMKYECKNCGMVVMLYKNLEDFRENETN